MLCKILFLGLFFGLSNFTSAVALAQHVTKVKGSAVYVKIDSGQNFKEGEKVNFISDELNQAARGTVKKISEGKTSMIVDLTEGKVEDGMIVEKISVKTESKKYNESLTEEERRILDQGEISTSRYVIGGILGTYPIGLGIGHAVQGRYSEKGWIFTVGELTSIAVAVAGLGSCSYSDYNNGFDCNSGLIFLGIYSYIGFRIWEIVDVWAAPVEHNSRYNSIKSRVGNSAQWDGFVVPVKDGGLFALQYRF